MCAIPFLDIICSNYRKSRFFFQNLPAKQSVSLIFLEGAVEHLEAEADDEKSSGAASRGYSGSNLFDPENPDYSTDLSNDELNGELEDEHDEFEEDDLNVEF